MRTSHVLFLALITVAALALACSKKSSSPTQPRTGGAVETFDSGTFSSASTPHVFVHTYATAGTFGYHCSVHGAAMSGSVTVADGMPDSALVNIVNNAYSPSSVSIQPGGYVKWTNTGSVHSVTSP